MAGAPLGEALHLRVVVQAGADGRGRRRGGRPRGRWRRRRRYSGRPGRQGPAHAAGAAAVGAHELALPEGPVASRARRVLARPGAASDGWCVDHGRVLACSLRHLRRSCRRRLGRGAVPPAAPGPTGSGVLVIHRARGGGSPSGGRAAPHLGSREVLRRGLRVALWRTLGAGAVMAAVPRVVRRGGRVAAGARVARARRAEAAGERTEQAHHLSRHTVHVVRVGGLGLLAQAQRRTVAARLRAQRSKRLVEVHTRANAPGRVRGHGGHVGDHSREDLCRSRAPSAGASTVHVAARGGLLRARHPRGVVAHATCCRAVLARELRAKSRVAVGDGLGAVLEAREAAVALVIIGAHRILRRHGARRGRGRGRGVASPLVV
mmetsp:Transcript_13086/g.39472  ORF Transcript_13086/g.39472 Transcript_13086/m.39472 type:complete len:377 (-) Transcript_13086:595-1725(-)